MRHHHRWPFIILLPVIFFLPTILANPNPSKSSRQHLRQLHRLVGGHLRIPESDSDDSELITASAGENSKTKKKTNSNNGSSGGGGGDEERKTLSQQVADGKYGLIQKEIFRVTPKRPGIISYTANPEVPKDNIATLGGLTKNDIWLAENHLLVIKGGTYVPHDDRQDTIWQPIDDYNAPLHQVKIPKNPKIPPPFPVQLTDDGPLQILGTNTTRTLNATAETPSYALPPPANWNGEIPSQKEYFPKTDASNSNSSNTATRETTMRDHLSGEPPGGMPFPPALLNGSLPHYFASLPPGAVILPAPQANETDQQGLIDEEDPSIYYPPPYSFFYPKDNSSAVPPGPLVPGIILPPPPKFFAPLEEEPAAIQHTKSISSRKPTPSPPTVAPITDIPLNNEIPQYVKQPPAKVSVSKSVTVKIGPSTVTRKPHHPISRIPSMPSKNASQHITTTPPKFITILPVAVDRLNRTYLPSSSKDHGHHGKKKLLPVAWFRPVTPVKNDTIITKLKPGHSLPDEQKYKKEKVHNLLVDERNKVNLDSIKQQLPYNDNNDVKFYIGLNSISNTTQIPLKYYTPIDHVEINSISTSKPAKYSIAHYSTPTSITTSTATSRTPSNLYFYEETNKSPPINLNPNRYIYEIPTNQPYRYSTISSSTATPQPPTVSPQNNNFHSTIRPQYIYVNGRPYESQKPRFQYIAPDMRRPQKHRPSNTFSIHIAKLQNQLHQYYKQPRTSPAPTKLSSSTSKPVYQYSFEAQNYNRQQFKPSPLLNDNNNDIFKPVPKYSVQIQPAIEIIPTQRPSYQHINTLNIEEPTYYTNSTLDENHNVKYYPSERPVTTRFQPYKTKITSSTKPNKEYTFNPTPNPIYQGFYTQPDEGYFDERTKESFTIFGRKLPSLITTTPRTVTKLNRINFRNNNKNNKPVISLHSDTNVNYLTPKPYNINPQSEYINNNYRNKNLENNPEIIKAIEITPTPRTSTDNKEQYIQYQLPGDQGAHFYFLTPQERRQENVNYY